MGIQVGVLVSMTKMSISLHLISRKYTCSEGWETRERRSSASNLISLKACSVPPTRQIEPYSVFFGGSHSHADTKDM